MPNIRYAKILRVSAQTSLLFAALTTFLFLVAIGMETTQSQPIRPPELFEASLSDINSLDKAETEIRHRLGTSVRQDSDIAATIEEFARARFYHGYSYHSFSENWVGWFAGLVWSDLSAKVDPNEIFKSSWAGCSQQAIAVQALLDRFNITYASLRTADPKHFATVARIDNQWVIVDSWDQLQRSVKGPISLVSIRTGQIQPFTGELGRQYVTALKRGAYVINSVNATPAPNQTVFDTATHTLSRWGWLWLWVAFFALNHLSNGHRSKRIERQRHVAN